MGLMGNKSVKRLMRRHYQLLSETSLTSLMSLASLVSRLKRRYYQLLSATSLTSLMSLTSLLSLFFDYIYNMQNISVLRCFPKYRFVILVTA